MNSSVKKFMVILLFIIGTISALFYFDILDFPTAEDSGVTEKAVTEKELVTSSDSESSDSEKSQETESTSSDTESGEWEEVYWDLLNGKTLAANKDMGMDDKKVFCLDSYYDHQFALVKAENFLNPLLVVMNECGHVNIIHYDSIVTYTGPARATENSADPEVYFSKDLKRIQLKETMSDPKNWGKWEDDYDESWLVETYFEVGRAKDGAPILNYARQKGLQGPIVGIEPDDTGLVPIVTNAEGSNILWKSYFDGQEKALSDQDFQSFVSDLESVSFKEIDQDNFLKEVERVSQ